MPIIHFLNVNEGDCSVIQHYSGRVTVIDVCNARLETPKVEADSGRTAHTDSAVKGNFRQKNHPVNPVDYLSTRGITSIWRYVQTHPDMDHMDGIKDLFAHFSPLNMWDTDNTKEMDESSWEKSPYREEDWNLYKRLRDLGSTSDPKRLTPLSGAKGQYWNVGGDGSSGGDGLDILAPSQTLVDTANESGNFNDCSYVILYKFGNKKIVFSGDSDDKTWEHILENHEDDVTDIDLLVAPHHGRDSGRSYKFLDTLNPLLTLFGNASSKHLAYSAWNNRDLPFITNNQANCVVIDAGADPMKVYATYETFARAFNRKTSYNDSRKAWFLTRLVR